MAVEGIGRALAPAIERGQAGRSGIPVRHAVGGGDGEIVIAGGARRLEQQGIDRRAAAARLAGLVRHCLDEFELLGKAEHRPRQAPRPGAERRIALLGAGSAIGAVGHVEETLVRDAASDVESIAPAAEVDVEGGGRPRVLHQPLEQVDLRVLFLHQRLTEHEAERQRAQRAERVDEQRMRAVERVDETAVGQLRPAAGLDSAAHFQRELVEPQFPVACGHASFARQPPQVAVGADVVEPVVVHAHVGEVRGHSFHSPRSSELEKARVARRVELQQRRPELEALCPLRPAARLIPALHGEHRCALFGPPHRFDGQDLRGRQIEQVIDLGEQIAR